MCLKEALRLDRISVFTSVLSQAAAPLISLNAFIQIDQAADCEKYLAKWFSEITYSYE
jgi:hypothetical protein